MHFSCSYGMEWLSFSVRTRARSGAYVEIHSRANQKVYFSLLQPFFLVRFS